jgi:NADH-quinone oxidoreductase subunit G
MIHRGDAAEISTYIEKAIDNDFSGNVIDVCPVGALTDRTFRFKSRVWFTKPMNAHRNCTKCSGKTIVWMSGEDVLRVSARKDKYGEVEEWICNDCRFEKKEVKDWTIEGPRAIDRNSVISQNHYETVKQLKIDVSNQKQIVESAHVSTPLNVARSTSKDVARSASQNVARSTSKDVARSISKNGAGFDSSENTSNN